MLYAIVLFCVAQFDRQIQKGYSSQQGDDKSSKEHGVANHVSPVKIATIVAVWRTMSRTSKVAKRIQGFRVLWWIGHGGPVAWPPRSPDLNSLDFFLWGYLKSLVYQTSVDTMENLTAGIAVTSTGIANSADLFERVCRCRLCYDLRGCNFKAFL
ncbi:uncharacterized protein TNCV_4984101 [Trichonephila clavipes]|nr:uncharacterized protein TNCV_4984101 [Trichonephila clavipes]